MSGQLQLAGVADLEVAGQFQADEAGADAGVLDLAGAGEVEAFLERASDAQDAAKRLDFERWMTAVVGPAWTLEQAREVEVAWMLDCQVRRPELWDPYAGVPGAGEEWHYRSGSNHLGELRAMVDLGEHVGVAVHRLSAEAEEYLVQRGRADAALVADGDPLGRLRSHVRVFADSGAFEEFSTGEEIDDVEWRVRLGTYRRLAGALGGRLAVVGPDRLGDQEGTLERLRRYSAELERLAGLGAEVMLTVATGALGREAFWQEAKAAAGEGRWVPAFPMRRRTASLEELEAFAAAVKPERLHLLGIGPGSERYAEAVAAVRRGWPECEVSSDSVWLCAVVGRQGRGGRGRLGTEERDRLLANGYPAEDVAGLKEAWVRRAMVRHRHEGLLRLARGGWRWGAVPERPRQMRLAV